jgi:hypothetical protein
MATSGSRSHHGFREASLELFASDPADMLDIGDRTQK